MIERARESHGERKRVRYSKNNDFRAGCKLKVKI